jgi:hypothetical protein
MIAAKSSPSNSSLELGLGSLAIESAYIVTARSVRVQRASFA